MLVVEKKQSFNGKFILNILCKTFGACRSEGNPTVQMAMTSNNL